MLRKQCFTDEIGYMDLINHGSCGNICKTNTVFKVKIIISTEEEQWVQSPISIQEAICN